MSLPRFCSRLSILYDFKKKTAQILCCRAPLIFLFKYLGNFCFLYSKSLPYSTISQCVTLSHHCLFLISTKFHNFKHPVWNGKLYISCNSQPAVLTATRSLKTFFIRFRQGHRKKKKIKTWFKWPYEDRICVMSRHIMFIAITPKSARHLFKVWIPSLYHKGGEQPEF